MSELTQTDRIMTTERRQSDAPVAVERRTTTLPIDSRARKQFPIDAGFLAYFPAAVCGVAWISQMANEKHNPGQPLHWSRWNSGDHAECIQRHQIDRHENGGYEQIQYADDGSGRMLNYWATVDGRPVGPPQVLYAAWRALAQAQEWLEQHENAPLAPGARVKP